MDHGHDVRCRRADPAVGAAELDDGRSAQGGRGGCGVVSWLDCSAEKKQLIKEAI